MDDLSLWQTMMEAWKVLQMRFEPVVVQHCSECSLDLQEWGLLLAVLKFEPDATAPVDLMVRSPYTAAEVFINGLRSAAQKEWLVETSPGTFRLTETGRQICLDLIDVARKVMVDIDPLSTNDSQKLIKYINKLIQASFDLQPPPNPWSLKLSYKLMPEEDPAMPYIEQGFTCLSGYREDAQLASWTLTGMSATALDMMALLWRGEADSLDSICDRLSHRGHSCEVYEAVLSDLRDVGYVNGDDNALFATGSGRVFCNQVEATTDYYFFTPWSCLSEAEKSDLSSILNKLFSGLETEITI